MAAGLSDFSKDIRIVDKLSKLHLQPIRGIVERRLTPAETVSVLEYDNTGHVRGLTQEMQDCLMLRHGFQAESFPSITQNHFSWRTKRNQNYSNGYEPNTNNAPSTRRRGRNTWKAIQIPTLKKHSLFKKYPELLSYSGAIPLQLYSITSDENLRWVHRNGDNATSVVSGPGLGANAESENENGRNNLTLLYDTYTVYIALMPLWTGEVYVYIYWFMDIPEPSLSNEIHYIQNILTMCARPAPLPVLGNIPRSARQMERLGLRRTLGRIPNQVSSIVLAMRGPGEHLARHRKTRKQHK